MPVLASARAACPNSVAVRALLLAARTGVITDGGSYYLWLCSAAACRNSRISHVGSDGSTVGGRIKDAGYTTFPQAENIAKGQTSAHQVSWHVV
jgi:hypothetical protein